MSAPSDPGGTPPRTIWRGWLATRGEAASVRSSPLAKEAAVQSRLLTKTRSWVVLDAPLELLSPLSILREDPVS